MKVLISFTERLSYWGIWMYLTSLALIFFLAPEMRSFKKLERS